MLRYLSQKISYLVLTLVAVVAANFVLFHLMPGDPVTHIARGQHLDAEAIARLRTYYGLDQPMASQFVTYLQNLLKGDLGFSYTYQASVGPIVVKALANTLILVTVSTLLVILLGVLIGCSPPPGATHAPTPGWSSDRWCSGVCPRSGWACC